MQARGKLIAILIVTAVVLGAFPFTAAESDSLRVIMTSESGEYQVGDTIQVFIHVFEKGLPDDADSITVTLYTHWQHFPTNLTAKSISRGLYSVTYIVEEGDNYANFHAEVVSGNDADYADLHLDVVEPDVEVSVLFDHSRMISALPGEKIEADVLVTYRNNPIDVDRFDPLRIEYGDGSTQNLTANRISQGHYNISIPVKNLKHSDIATLRVDAHYVNDHSEGTATVFINPMTVWYHPISLTGGTATFKLGVADPMGRAVSGARIHLDNNGHMETTDFTTDSNGTATIIVPNTYEGAHISGYVLNGTLNQSFSGTINTEPEQLPNPNGHHFDVIPSTLNNYYRTGESVTREYTAYNSSVPMQNKVIYYYVVSSPFSFGDMGVSVPDAVLKNGSVTTNDLGEFTVEIPAVANQSMVNIYFEAPIPPNINNYNPLNPNDHLDLDDNMVYEEDHDTIYILGGNPWNSPDVRISISSLKIGETTQVSVTFPEMEETDTVFLVWNAFGESESAYIRENGRLPYQQTDVPEWSSWAQNGGVVTLHRTSGSTFEGTAYIPAFMVDQNITFTAMYIDESTGLMYANSVVVAPGEGGSSMSSPLGSYIIPLIVAIVVIVGAALFLFMRKKEKKPKAFQPQRMEAVAEPEVGPMPTEQAEQPPAPAGNEYIPWQPESQDGKPPVF